ncbi:MAG: hypothetical protein IMZ64_07955 [Bacteroidetes bacterium]|nr:hypothetical protein [Bacteroidota bacterium]MBE3141242.1 hypothetical protein [Thermoplasmata archaeon]
MKPFLIILSLLISFLFGYFIHHPKEKIITKTEQVMVYDLTQSPEVIEAYANMKGKIIITEEERLNQLNNKWREGLSEGFQKGVRSCYK